MAAKKKKKASKKKSPSRAAKAKKTPARKAKKAVKKTAKKSAKKTSNKGAPTRDDRISAKMLSRIKPAEIRIRLLPNSIRPTYSAPRSSQKDALTAAANISV